MAYILIADDDDSFRRLIRLWLQGLGHEVADTGDGRAALEMVDHMTPDLLITDLVMPGVDGMEVIYAINHSHPALKIIAMSGGGRVPSSDLLRVASHLGADRVLAKPFSTDELAANLASLGIVVDPRDQTVFVPCPPLESGPP